MYLFNVSYHAHHLRTMVIIIKIKTKVVFANTRHTHATLICVCPDNYYISDKMWKHVPKKYRAVRDHGYLENKILHEHEKYLALSKHEAQIKYLATVSKYQSYGCTFFSALVIDNTRTHTHTHIHTPPCK